jgi:hypothetical protein
LFTNESTEEKNQSHQDIQLQKWTTSYFRNTVRISEL